MEEVLFELQDYPQKRIVFDADTGARAAGEDHQRRRSQAVYPLAATSSTAYSSKLQYQAKFRVEGARSPAPHRGLTWVLP
jgi:hypothetical protein